MTTVDNLAAAMHVAYETEAVRAGWETQERSRVPYSALPEANKRAMRAGVIAMLDLLYRDGWRKTTSESSPLEPASAKANPAPSVTGGSGTESDSAPTYNAPSSADGQS